MADATPAATADAREAAVLDRITEFRRRRPRLRDDVITLAHGAGGKASAALVDAVFLEAFTEGESEPLPDAATLTLPTGERVAFSTDSFVVKPLRFPGGSIGHLAVHGTVNDLAVQGAQPAWLSVAFVIEEGFPVAELREIVADMAEAARAAGVQIVTGDTKVVGRGAADGLFITSAGVGVIPSDRELGPARVHAGDRVLVSGTLADHGMAVMLAAATSHSKPTSGPTPRRWATSCARCSRRHRTRAGCATRRVAASARSPTSWRATPGSRSCSTKRRCRCCPR